MVFHGAEKEHLMSLSFSDLSVWCYGCEYYIDNERLYAFKNLLHRAKFGEEMPMKEGEKAPGACTIVMK